MSPGFGGHWKYYATLRNVIPPLHRRRVTQGCIVFPCVMNQQPLQCPPKTAAQVDYSSVTGWTRPRGVDGIIAFQSTGHRVYGESGSFLVLSFTRAPRT